MPGASAAPVKHCLALETSPNGIFWHAILAFSSAVISWGTLAEAQERLKRLLEAQSRGPTMQPQDPGSQVTSLQQMVNTLQPNAMLWRRRLHQAKQTVEDDVQPVTKKQAVARQVNSFRDPHVPTTT